MVNVLVTLRHSWAAHLLQAPQDALESTFRGSGREITIGNGS